MAMQKLNVRFSDETKRELIFLSCNTNIPESALARAAINIGMSCIEASIEIDDMSHLNKLVEQNQ
jgi:predicted DNA-binding protein